MQLTKTTEIEIFVRIIHTTIPKLRLTPKIIIPISFKKHTHTHTHRGQCNYCPVFI